jgi:hypothetical protein
MFHFFGLFVFSQRYYPKSDPRLCRKFGLLESGLWFTPTTWRQEHADVTDEITAKGEVMKVPEPSAKDPKCCETKSKAVMRPSMTAFC